MDLETIIFSLAGAAGLLFVLIGLGRGVIMPPPLYGPPEKNSSTKAEPPNNKPSR
jgi:hypothetical protein